MQLTRHHTLRDWSSEDSHLPASRILVENSVLIHSSSNAFAVDCTDDFNHMSAEDKGFLFKTSLMTSRVVSSRILMFMLRNAEFSVSGMSDFLKSELVNLLHLGEGKQSQ